jgi:hypothetical protein
MTDKNLEARLEIRLSASQLQKLKDEAKRKNTSVGELVREAIGRQYEISVEEKLNALKKMAEMQEPVSDWETLKKEIEAGHYGK